MLLAIRSNERAAGSVGINVAQGKLMAFGLAAFIAGIGGALTGYMQGELTADSFAAFTSISLLAIVFVAGVGRISGAVVAGVMFSAAGLFVTFLDIHLSVGKYQAIVAGVALVLTAVQNPDGLTSTSTGKGSGGGADNFAIRRSGCVKPDAFGPSRADRPARHTEVTRVGARERRGSPSGRLTCVGATLIDERPPGPLTGSSTARPLGIGARSPGSRGGCPPGRSDSSHIGSGPTTGGTAVGEPGRGLAGGLGVDSGGRGVFVSAVVQLAGSLVFAGLLGGDGILGR